MKKGFGCNSCTHPTCAYGVNSTGVSGCVECDGVLVLDPSAPKWKLACNRYVERSNMLKFRIILFFLISFVKINNNSTLYCTT